MVPGGEKMPDVDRGTATGARPCGTRRPADPTAFCKCLPPAAGGERRPKGRRGGAPFTTTWRAGWQGAQGRGGLPGRAPGWLRRTASRSQGHEGEIRARLGPRLRSALLGQRAAGAPPLIHVLAEGGERMSELNADANLARQRRAVLSGKMHADHALVRRLSEAWTCSLIGHQAEQVIVRAREDIEHALAAGDFKVIMVGKIRSIKKEFFSSSWYFVPGSIGGSSASGVRTVDRGS